MIARSGDDFYRLDLLDGGGFGAPGKVEQDVTVTYSTTETHVDPSAPIRVGAGQTVKGTARIREAAEATLLEAVDGTGPEGGHVWKVTMVRPGLSKNRRRYKAEVLREAANLYEGARSFDGHRDDMDRRRSNVTSLAGWHQDVTVADDGSLQSTFHIAEHADHIRQLFLTAWEAGRPDLIGFSHDVTAIAAETKDEKGRKIQDVRKITEVHSVDVVADPSAGGKIERLVASTTIEGEPMTLAELTALVDEDPELAAGLRQHLAGPGEDTDTDGEAADEGTDETPAADAPVTEAFLQRLALREAATAAHLPDAAVAKLKDGLKPTDTIAMIEARVQETADIWQAALAAHPSPLRGQAPNVSVGDTDMDKAQKALDAMIGGVRQIDGVPAFRSLKEAYTAITGRQPYGMPEEDFNRWILAESVGAVPYQSRVTESITTSTWDQAFADSITRRLIAEYQLPAFNTWRAIASEIGTINDFRTNRRVRVGGYDTLPVVGQGATYAALTSPSDEEATYAISKRGGTEDLTLEAIANDDLSAVRRIPRNLGAAAALTLYRAVWITTIAGNAAIYDAVNLFDAAHSNTSAQALAEAGITVLRTAMVHQTRPGQASGSLFTRPRFLVVPSELYVTAYKLARSETAVVGTAESATTPNPYQGLEVIEVPEFTDTNDWFLVADPATIPTLEVGFYQGRDDPELLVQDQPLLGSVFTADKITWKIRHIWGLAVLDFRGFQRGTQ